MKPFDSLALFSLIMFISGCSFSAPQLDSILSRMGGGVSVGEGLDQTFLWTADFNSQGRLVKLYEGGPDGFVFGSEEGDVLSFDGWVIKSVTGFGLQDGIRISDSEGMRRYRTGPRAERSQKCLPWVKADDMKEGIRWTQKCAGAANDNEILIDESGRVVLVRQTLTYDGKQVLLKKL